MFLYITLGKNMYFLNINSQKSELLGQRVVDLPVAFDTRCKIPFHIVCSSYTSISRI